MNEKVAKKPKMSKSKRRKYASQPRGSTKGKKLRDAFPVMDLPMSKIKESLPRMTFFNNDHYSLPKEINGVQVVQRKTSRHSSNSKQRSMSASSANSNRSFRVTRKKPFVTMSGPTDAELGRFKATGAKFLKAVAPQ